MNLFALTDDPSKRKLRFSISRDIQEEIEYLFKHEERRFNRQDTTIVDFDGKYRPEEDELLRIPQFIDIDELSTAIVSPLSIPEIEPSEDVFGSIKALFTGYTNQNGAPVVLIQYFNKKKIISTNGISIFHSSNAYRRIEGIGLSVENSLLAILNGDELLFSSFHLLRRIFDLSEYYREATDCDIEAFSQIESIHVSDPEQLLSMSDNWVRRKIWLISQSPILNQYPMNEIKAAAAEFSIPFNTTVVDGTEKMEIPSTKRELKSLLRFLDEDYYKSPILQKKYLSNSKKEA